ncbi:f-box protein cpr1 [Quercus suber]|uniref:F-box protein cpr1 n=2 Tax=Quercus suber TaxID=58331 RepID=A0AAW0IX69_QUESU
MLPWISSSPAVSTNGAAHWLTIPDRSVPGQEIFAFDFANNEEFHFYKTPVQRIDTDDIQKTGLGVLGGCLCFVVNDCKNLYHDVWLMKEYGVESSWTKVYKTDLRANKISLNTNFGFVKPLKFSRDGKKVLLENSKNLFWYDLEKKRSERLKVQKLPVLFRPLTSTGSLLLLDDGDSVIDPKQNKIKK